MTVLTNDGAGGFILAATCHVGAKPDGLAAGDLNGDGRLDLVSVNHDDNTMTVLTNDGSGGFAASATITGQPGTSDPSSVAVADVNGDGHLDLVRANTGDGGGQWASTLTVLTNDGSGGFVYDTTLQTGGRVPNVVSADLNGDGRPDLICPNFVDASVTVLLNVTAFPQSFVSTFDTGADGWTVKVLSSLVTTNPQVVVSYELPAYNASTGNPGGCISTQDSAGEPTEPHMVAPAKFLGDKSAFYGGVLSFDVTCNLTLYGNSDQVILVGNGHALFYSNADVPGWPANTWTNWAVSLAPSARWRLDDYATGRSPTAAEFKAVLASLQELNISGDLGNGPDITSMDNVRLAKATTPQIQSPRLTGGYFTFSLATVSGQSYTVQQNVDLATANWVTCTNWFGDGSVRQAAFPATNGPQIFYRVQTP